MTHLLDRLEEHGWVRRVPDLPDRRTIRVELTETGQAKLAEALPVEATVIAAAFRHLRPDDSTRLAGLLARLDPSATTTR